MIDLYVPKELKIGSLYKRKYLHDLYGGQQQGGISTPRSYPFIFLFSSDRGRDYGYEDGWKEDGFYHYTGEGQKGDMKFERGNKAIRDHVQNGKALLLFETLPNGLRRFIGPMDYVDHYYKEIPDEEGNLRRGIIFRLTPASIDFYSVIEQISSEGLAFLSKRETALAAAAKSTGFQKKEGKRNYYQRSAQVASYVLERANGFCEACGRPGPFDRSDGTPYLEPHHIRRLSDNGPDDPRYVIACCPTCHKRVHYGKDGEEFNESLAKKVLRIEEAIASENFIVVTAAILVNDEGKVLITQRNSKGYLANKWEFPGGKVKLGETLVECLCREIEEELALKIKRPEPFLMVDYKYPEFHVRLFSFLTGVEYGSINLKEHQKSKWVSIPELSSFDLAKADRLIAEVLKSQVTLYKL